MGEISTTPVKNFRKFYKIREIQRKKAEELIKKGVLPQEMQKSNHLPLPTITTAETALSIKKKSIKKQKITIKQKSW